MPTSPEFTNRRISVMNLTRTVIKRLSQRKGTAFKAEGILTCRTNREQIGPGEVLERGTFNEAESLS
jgi:hypothetical protein